MAKNRSGHLFELAKKGAEARLRELVTEARTLFATFPHLRDAFDADELPLSFIVAEKSGRLERTGRGRQQRRRLSADARKRISDAQKRRWAKQKRQGS